jgi:hypothetical protein
MVSSGHNLLSEWAGGRAKQLRVRKSHTARREGLSR